MIAACANSTLDVLTAIYAEAIGTLLALCTWPRLGAVQIWRTLSSFPRVPPETFVALANTLVAGVDNAVRIDATPNFGTR